MILCNRNNFLQVSIVLIIVTFSEELSVQRNRGVREVIRRKPTNQRNNPKTQSNQGFNAQILGDQVYYHRNDIGHLNEYYQERMKLREQYNAIQKSLHERDLQNNTSPKDRKRSNFINSLPGEKHKSPNVNSLDAFHALKPEEKNVNQAFEENTTKENITFTTEINNIETGSQNKTYVKMGECRGHVIYHQNIVIAGASYNAMNGYSVDVNLGGICITCIEIRSKNDREVKVTLTSGGPGEANTSLNFEGLNKDIDISYVLKVWGVGEDC